MASSPALRHCDTFWKPSLLLFHFSASNDRLDDVSSTGWTPGSSFPIVRSSRLARWFLADISHKLGLKYPIDFCRDTNNFTVLPSRQCILSIMHKGIAGLQITAPLPCKNAHCRRTFRVEAAAATEVRAGAAAKRKQLGDSDLQVSRKPLLLGDPLR